MSHNCVMILYLYSAYKHVYRNSLLVIGTWLVAAEMPEM